MKIPKSQPFISLSNLPPAYCILWTRVDRIAITHQNLPFFKTGFRKSSNEFRQSSVFRRPQHGFFDLLHLCFQTTFVLNKGRKRRVGFTHGKCSKNYLSHTGTPAPHTNTNRFPMMHISIFNSKQDLIKFKNSIPSMKSRLCKIPINRMPYFYLNPP